MFTTRIKVKLEVIIAIESDKHPQKVPATDMDTFILENTEDTIAQFNTPDLKAAIVGHEIINVENPNLKCTCGADLTKPRSVSRLYVSKDEGGEDSHCLGHYNEVSEDFETDGSPSYPLEHHDLLDNSDECQNCGATTG